METEEEKMSSLSKCSSTDKKTFLQGCVWILQNLVVNGLRTSLEKKKRNHSRLAELLNLLFILLLVLLFKSSMSYVLF